jgi:hypothetical protein
MLCIKMSSSNLSVTIKVKIIKKVRFDDKTKIIIVERIPIDLWYSSMELQSIINESKEESISGELVNT